MRLLRPIPDLGPCEGRWVTTFGVHRSCSYRASESFEPPCGHVHRLCATCVYALERGMGTWDEASDLLHFGVVTRPGGKTEAVVEDFVPSLPIASGPRSDVLRHRAALRRTGRVPLNVAIAGIGVLAAVIVSGLPSVVMAAAMAAEGAVLLYSIPRRERLHR